MAEWTKAIPEARDRLQSRALVLVMGLFLAVPSTLLMVLMLHPNNAGYWSLRAGIISLTFAGVVWALRAATPAAAFFGGIICLLVTLMTGASGSRAEMRSGLSPLLALFVLTYLAGKIGRIKKRRSGMVAGIAEHREAKHGRNAAQVLANLGVAGFASTFALGYDQVGRAMLLAVLAEATADTVSSEIGSAFGGRPFLLTSLVRVEPGTDGAVSLTGTVAGIAGASLVVMLGAWAMRLETHPAGIALISGVAGLFFDSVLGATVERRGWLGNDLVNFSSTLFAALVAGILVAL